MPLEERFETIEERCCFGARLSSHLCFPHWRQHRQEWPRLCRCGECAWLCATLDLAAQLAQGGANFLSDCGAKFGPRGFYCGRHLATHLINDLCLRRRNCLRYFTAHPGDDLAYIFGKIGQSFCNCQLSFPRSETLK